MKKSIKQILICGVTICALPFAAHAALSVDVVNHTKANSTANARNPSTKYNSPCSSSLGPAGIITPEYNTDAKPYTIPGWAIGMVCDPKCEVAVYMDNNCNARKIATGFVSPGEGVVGEVTNLPNPDGFYIKKISNTKLYIEGGPKASIFDKMMRKLGL